MSYFRILLLTGGACFFITACIGPPEITEYYKEVVGPKVSGCLNKYSAVIAEEKCTDYRIGDVVVELIPRGSKKYYQDPERSPYKLSALVCNIQRGDSFDIAKNLRIEEVVVTTNTDKTFTDFKWGIVHYNKNCKYISLTPKVNIKVQDESELRVKLLVTLMSPKMTTKEMDYAFNGKSEWFVPFYGP